MRGGGGGGREKRGEGEEREKERREGKKEDNDFEMWTFFSKYLREEVLSFRNER